MFDVLESRMLLASSLDGGTGLLTIDGTSGNDDLSVAVAAGTLTVTLNGATDGTFDVTQVIAITVNGQDGNDTLSLAGVDISSTMDGGNGSDTITGGTGHDTLLGGEGDDSFISNDGQADTVNGGNGNDTATGDNTLDTYISIEFGIPLPAPKISVSSGGDPVVDGTSTIDFGSATQGTSGPTVVFTVSNDGDDTLTLGSLTLPAGYTVIDSLVGSLDPGQSDTFSLRLDTANTGTFAGEVSFSNSDPNKNPFNFNVTGVVVPPVVQAPDISVRLARPDGPIDNGNSTVEFGNRGINASAPTRTFRVYNVGNTDLTVGDITLPAGFTLVDPLVGPITPGHGESFTIRMDTNVMGSRDGFVSIANNDPDEAPFTFRIVGTVGINNGPSPEVTVNTYQKGQLRGVASGISSFDYGVATKGGQRPARTFRVSNDGDATLSLGRISVPAGFVVLDGLPSSLKSGQTDNLVIALDTATLGSKSGIVSFSTNDNNENPFTFSVRGTVAAPAGGTVITATLSGGTLTVTGTSGVDTISFGVSSKGLSVYGNSKTISGSPFNGVGRIVVNGNDGGDRILATSLNVPLTIYGGNGNDTLYGGNAADAIYGGNGDDLLDGGNGNDSLFGGSNNDVLTGGAGLDSMKGDDGNDTLNASDGLADLLVDGGAGNDIIHKDRTDNATNT